MEVETGNKIKHMKGINIITRSTYIERLHDLQVGHVDLGVLGEVGVLLGHHHALLEEVLVDGDQILLGHQHSVGNEVYL